MLLVKEMAEKWWLIALRGGLAMLLGLVLIVYPAKTLVMVTWVVGLWALFEGILLAIMALIKHDEVNGWGWLMLQGFFGVLLGLALMAIPVVSLKILFFMVGVWLLVVGIMLLIQALQVRKELMAGEWLLIAAAVLSMLFGIVLMGNISVSVAVAGFLLGLVMLVTGIFTVAFGFQLKRETKKIQKLKG